MFNKKLALAAAAILATTAAVPASATTYVVSGTGGTADNSLFNSIVTVPVTFLGKIAKVVVTLNGLTASESRDVRVVLLHNGSDILLANGNGQGHDLNGDYTFTDDGATVLSQGPIVPVDTRDPSVVYDFVSGSFNGLDAAGTYRLNFRDLRPGNPSSITGWTLYLSVPEPATWAMMLGGFGFVGAMMRRRKSVGQGLAAA